MGVLTGMKWLQHLSYTMPPLMKGRHTMWSSQIIEGAHSKTFTRRQIVHDPAHLTVQPLKEHGQKYYHATSLQFRVVQEARDCNQSRLWVTGRSAILRVLRPTFSNHGLKRVELFRRHPQMAERQEQFESTAGIALWSGELGA
jgi:hypothetical protein